MKLGLNLLEAFYVSFDRRFLVLAVTTLIAVYTTGVYAQPTFVGKQTMLPVDSLTSANLSSAADASGNLYVTDTNAGLLMEFPAGKGEGHQITLASNLAQPTGVSVDAAGNIFFLQSNSGIFELPAGKTSLSRIVGPTFVAVGSITGIFTPVLMTADSAGNVFFIAETASNQIGIFEKPFNKDMKSLYKLPSSQFSFSGIAVDTAGNIYYSGSDFDLFEIYAGTTNTRDLGFGGSTGLSSDPAGNLFLITGNSSIVEIPANGGSPLDVPHSPVAVPSAVAANASGDIFIVGEPLLGNTITGVEESLGAVNLGVLSLCSPLAQSPSCTNTATLNYRIPLNSNLSFTTLTEGVPNVDFTNIPAYTYCQSYVYDQLCSIEVGFSPAFPGLRRGAVEVRDNEGVSTTSLYGVGVAPELVFAPGTQTVVARGLNFPTAVAVDLAGNIYVAQLGNAQVIKLTAAGGRTVVPTKVSNPTALAVDGAGDLYILDSDRVVMIPATTNEQETIIEGLPSPAGLALDGAGNLYTADGIDHSITKFTSAGVYITVYRPPVTSIAAIALDSTNNIYIADSIAGKVAEINSAGDFLGVLYPQTKGQTPLYEANALAVDAAGDVYVANTEAGSVLQLLGNRSLVETITSKLNQVSGVAVSVAGDVFIADTGNNQILKVQRSQIPSLSFAPTKVNSTSSDSPHAVSLRNIGNATLSGSGTVAGDNFKVVGNPSSQFNCSVSSLQLSSGGYCDLNFDFTPIAIGSLTGTFTLSDNTLNYKQAGYAPFAMQTIQLAGTGQGDIQTITFTPITIRAAEMSATLFATSTSALPVSFASTSKGICSVSGSTLTLNLEGICTVQATQSGNTIYAAATPVTQSFLVLGASQTITFSIGASIPKIALTSFPVSASSTSGLAVTITSITPAVCTVSGLTANLLSAGTCTIYADQGGSSVYAAAAPVMQSFTVAATTQTIAFTVDSSTAKLAGSSLALSGTASSGLPLFFVSETPLICTVSGPVATLITFGTCTIQATQPGSGQYMPAIPATQSFAVSLPTFDLGSASVCSAGQLAPAPCNTTLTVNYTLPTDGTLGTPRVITGGIENLDFTLTSSTCNGVKAAGATCMIQVMFAPNFAGPRAGAIHMVNATGHRVKTILIRGLGIGPQIAFSLGEQTQLRNGFSDPEGVAVDPYGNIFVADTNNNRVIKVFAKCCTSQTVLGTGLNSPTGLALNGAGDVFIADTGNNRVVKVPNGGGSLTNVGSGLNRPQDVAVDSTGNVFIADTGNGRVLEVPIGVSAPQTVGSGWSSPRAVAVDASGNVFVVDGNAITEVPATGAAQKVVVSGLSGPQRIAVDAAGDLYIAETLHNRVIEVQAGVSEKITVGTGLSGPAGVTVGSAGNVFIADTLNNRLLLVQRAMAPALNFAGSGFHITSTDSPQSVVVQNVGNATLNSSGFAFTTPPGIVQSFFQVPDPGQRPDCAIGGFSLPSGQGCDLSISFTPQALDSPSANVVFTDNSLNAQPATQSLSLSGYTYLTDQSYTFTPITTQLVGTSLILSASNNTGIPISFKSLTTGTCSVSGTTASSIAVGACKIRAYAPGNQNYLPLYADQTFAIVAAVPPPVFSPEVIPEHNYGGNYGLSQSVTLSDAVGGTSIYYSIGIPLTSGQGTLYTGVPILVSTSEQIFAVARMNGFADSPVASAQYIIDPVFQCGLIDYSKGFNASGLTLNSGATVSGSALQLTDGDRDEARSAFFTKSIPLSSFVTDFTFQILNPAGDGFAFVVQSKDPITVGGNGGGLGYAGIPNSSAVKFDLINNDGEGSDSTGVYRNGAYPGTPANDLTNSGIDLHSGHIFAAHLTYDGWTLTTVLMDTVTGATYSFRTSGPLTSGPTAYLGFTGATGSTTSTVNILTWSYTSGTPCASM